MRKIRKRSLFFNLSTICFIFYFSCIGINFVYATSENYESDKVELTYLEDIKVDTPLRKKFDNIIIGEFKQSQQIKTDYPLAADDCSMKIVDHLKSKKAFKSVTSNANKKLSGRTAHIDFEITDMRIPSYGARMWGGAFVGSAYMIVSMRVKDKVNGQVIYSKNLATSNSAWAASFSSGSSDRNLPADFGILVGEYLSQLIPAK